MMTGPNLNNDEREAVAKLAASGFEGVKLVAGIDGNALMAALRKIENTRIVADTYKGVDTGKLAFDALEKAIFYVQEQVDDTRGYGDPQGERADAVFCRIFSDEHHELILDLLKKYVRAEIDLVEQIRAEMKEES